MFKCIEENKCRRKKMIAVIRISGCVGVRREIVETLNRLRLRRKYSCIVFEQTKEKMGMVKKVKDFVAYGEINNETLQELIKKRGKKSEQVQKSSTSTQSVERGKKSKTFFRLHPPRGGIDSKKHFGVRKGVLGNNREEINKLIKRML